MKKLDINLPSIIRSIDPTFPNVITLCGSSRFKPIFHILGEKLEKEGNLVLMMSFFQHGNVNNNTSISISEEERDILASIDYHRIDLSDGIIVVDWFRRWCSTCNTWSDSKNINIYISKIYCSKCGDETGISKDPYIGEDTLREVKYAELINKRIKYLSKDMELTKYVIKQL